MSKWSFNTPYRLRDSRVSSGFQVSFTIDVLSSVALLFPSLWEQLSIWNMDIPFPFDDCSIELTCLSANNVKKRELRAGILIRPAYSPNLSADDVNRTTEQLKEHFSHWFSEKGIIFFDFEDEFSTLASYPVWDQNLSSHMRMNCYGKKANKLRLSNGSLLWFPEINEETSINLACLLSLLYDNPCSGMSIELHSLSRTFCKQAAKQNVEGDCSTWLNKIKENKGVYSRLISWGNREYLEDFSSELRTIVNVETEELEVDDILLHYFVYDPWAFEDQLPNRTSRLGMGRYALTYDELKFVFAHESISQKPQPPVRSFDDLVLAPVQAVSDSAKVETIDSSLIKSVIQSVVEESILPDMHHVISRVDQLQAETRNTGERVESWFEQLQYIQRTFEENTQEFARLAEKVDSISELTERFDNLAPEGFVAEFTADELHLMGVSEEKELIEIRKLDIETVHLMRTSFSLARTGMLADETKVTLMPFFIPLGSLFEHLMRQYFQPFLFDHTPLKTELDVKAAASPYQKRIDVQASDFDRISDAQIKAYVQHAMVDNSLHSDFYWRSWLNIFKPIRIARNKVHTTRGLVRMSQLICVYDLMLKPGIAPKIAALKYAFEHSNEDGERLFLGGMSFSAFQNEMCKNADSYIPSMIDFLLMCRDAKWVE